MAINKVVRAALKAISYKEIDVKENYNLKRNLVNLSHIHYLKPLYKSWDHEVYSKDHKIPVRIYAPDNEKNYPYIPNFDGECPETDYPFLLFFHGGGWVTGNIDSYNKVCTNMARMTKRMVVSVDYRLSPEFRFPNALHDCYEVAKVLRRVLDCSHTKDKSIVTIGDSAGGNLAAALSLLARDKNEFHIDKQILLYPSTYNDHSFNSPFESVRENGTDYLLTSKRICDYIDLYKSSDDDLLNPYFAPLLSKDFSNQPETLIITAEYDLLRDEGEEYGNKLREAGNLVETYRIKDALHGFFTLPQVFPQVKLCYDIINGFLNSEV